MGCNDDYRVIDDNGKNQRRERLIASLITSPLKRATKAWPFFQEVWR